MFLNCMTQQYERMMRWSDERLMHELELNMKKMVNPGVLEERKRLQAEASRRAKRNAYLLRGEDGTSCTAGQDRQV